MPRHEQLHCLVEPALIDGVEYREDIMAIGPHRLYRALKEWTTCKTGNSSLDRGGRGGIATLVYNLREAWVLLASIGSGVGCSPVVRTGGVVAC